MGRPRQQTDEIRILVDKVDHLAQQVSRPQATSASRAVNIMAMFNTPLESLAWGTMLTLSGAGAGFVAQQAFGEPWLQNGALGGLFVGCALMAGTAVLNLVGGLHIHITLRSIELSPNATELRDILNSAPVALPKVEHADRPMVELWNRQGNVATVRRSECPVDKVALRKISFAVLRQGVAFSRDPLVDRGACSQPQFNRLAQWMGNISIHGDGRALAEKVGNSWQLTSNGATFLHEYR